MKELQWIVPALGAVAFTFRAIWLACLIDHERHTIQTYKLP